MKGQGLSSVFARDLAAREAEARATEQRQQAPRRSRAQIVAAAIELLDADGGIEALSMRKLGARLGAGATSLYWYVANKDELFELIIDQVFGEIVLPEADAPDGGWRSVASAYARGLREIMLRHPWLTSLIGQTPNFGPNARALGNRLLLALRAGGFTGPMIGHASSTIYCYAYGATIPAIAVQRLARRSGLSADELFATARPLMEQLSSDYPELLAYYKEYAPTDVAANQAASFEFGLNCVLDGLAVQLPPPNSDPRRGRDTL